MNCHSQVAFVSINHNAAKENREIMAKLRVTQDDIKKVILMGVVATQKKIYDQLTTQTGLPVAINLIEESYDFGEGFLTGPSGPGFVRLISLNNQLKAGVNIADASTGDYPPEDPNHRAIVDRMLQAIQK